MHVALINWSVKSCLHSLVGVGQKSGSIIIKGEIGKILVFGCRFEHLEQSSRILPKVFVLNLSIVKIKVFAVQSSQL